MKTKVFVLASLLVLAFSMVLAISAQETPELCTAADSVNAQFGDGEAITTHQAVTKLFDGMTAAAEIDDMKTYLELSLLVRDMLTQIDTECRGFHFTSEEEGLKPVLGPISFPDGIWRAVLTTDQYGIVKVEALSGTCDGGFSLFNVSPGQAVEGAEGLFKTSEGCEALIQLDSIRTFWNLDFVPLKLTEE